MPETAKSWQRAKNLLCIRLDSMGDVLMTTPALRALKTSVPDRRITLLTSPSGEAVANLIPEVDRTLVYESPWMKATPPRANAKVDLNMIETLGKMKFDAAVIFTVFSQNPLPAALLCYLAAIPLRLAYCRENPYQLLTHWVPEIEPDLLIRHEVRRLLDLVKTVGARTDDETLSLRFGETDAARVRGWLRKFKIKEGQPWVVIHPGATAPSRRYSPEGFTEVARQLSCEHGIPPVFTGTESERPLVDQIRKPIRAHSHSLVGRLQLGEMAALLAQAPLLIANNTGPVHMAAALGTPVVDLYALTNPQHIPWQVPNRVLYHDVPCKYCYKSICPEEHHHCLELVQPSEVVAAARELLSR